MTKPKQPASKRVETATTIGEAAFAKISAVEGIRLNEAMKVRSADAVKRGLSADERREIIVRTYRKA